MEPCLVSCWGVFRMLSHGTAGVGLAHRGSRRQPRRSSSLRARSRDSMVRILQENPLRGIATVSQNWNCRWSIVTSIPDSAPPLTRTFAVHGRPLRDCCDTRPVFWVAMSLENGSLTGQTGTTRRGSCRACLPPAFAPQRPIQQLEPLSGPRLEVPSTATLMDHLTVIEPQGLSSVCHDQFLDGQGHTHLQPVADRSRRC
jgi:hypothetical protein